MLLQSLSGHLFTVAVMTIFLSCPSFNWVAENKNERFDVEVYFQWCYMYCIKKQNGIRTSSHHCLLSGYHQLWIVTITPSHRSCQTTTSLHSRQHPRQANRRAITSRTMTAMTTERMRALMTTRKRVSWRSTAAATRTGGSPPSSG